MYPLQCAGGFSMPAIAGKFELLGFSATIKTPASTSQFALIDDDAIIDGSKVGYVYSDISEKKGILANVKGLANGSGVLEVIFYEPVKTRYGVSVIADNLVPGSVCVYRR
jgi:hypothetical protein